MLPATSVKPRFVLPAISAGPSRNSCVCGRVGNAAESRQIPGLCRFGVRHAKCKVAKLERKNAERTFQSWHAVRAPFAPPVGVPMVLARLRMIRSRALAAAAEGVLQVRVSVAVRQVVPRARLRTCLAAGRKERWALATHV